MASRLELQTKLEEILGNRNVYFQPPASVKINYPAIIYSLKDIESIFANNSIYKKDRAYELIVIDKDPECVIVEKVLKFPMCSFDRYYAADNLNHYVFTLYY